jgi:hydrogen cyanide synthase HcnB
MSAPRIVIIGAGPAGIRAAQTLSEAGLRPVVIDEGIRSGGQIYRRPPASIVRDPTSVYGFDTRRALAIHRSFDDLLDRIDYKPETLVWSIVKGQLHISTGSGTGRLAWDRLILATGAMDRVIPFSGWTLPGVFTLGGAQVALKYQACAIGSRPVFFGSGPLLYLVAYQYAAAGVPVQAVLDTAPKHARLRSLPGLLRAPAILAKGAYYVAWLRTHGVPLWSGVRPIEAEAGVDGALARFVWRDAADARHETPCDALASGFGLRSETQLADLCGIPFVYEPCQRQWVPKQDADGRAAVDGIYLAGDGASIKGAIAAELSGERAAHLLLADLGLGDGKSRVRHLSRRLGRLDKVRVALEQYAFPFPADIAAASPDDLTVCRCEGITAGALREAASRLGASEINRIKAFTRLGMGRCQGRVCGTAAAEIIAAACNSSVEGVGRLRGQAPVKPISMAALAASERS